jgi:hypothetical protein
VASPFFLSERETPDETLFSIQTMGLGFADKFLVYNKLYLGLLIILNSFIVVLAG